MELREAIKPRDVWWAHFVIGPLANRLVGRLAPHAWITPNRVTLASLALGLAAAALLAVGRQPALAAAAVIVQLSFLLDCADGQLARFRGASSPFGALLDRISDRAKLFAVVLGLGYGLSDGARDPRPLLAAFVYFFCEYMIEVYVQSYRSLTADQIEDSSAAPAFARATLSALRVLDLPVLRLGFADRYFLVSAFALFGATSPLLWLLLGLGLAQLTLRPLYYLAAFRVRFGRWPWAAS